MIVIVEFKSELDYDLIVQVLLDGDQLEVLSVMQQEGNECYMMMPEVVLTESDMDVILDKVDEMVKE